MVKELSYTFVITYGEMELVICQRKKKKKDILGYTMQEENSL